MTVETLTRTNVKQAVPFFNVTDIKASLRFYVDGIGFHMTNQWIDDRKLRWCWLQFDGAALMLQEWTDVGRKLWWPEGAKLGIGVSVCFMCEDAISIYRDVARRGLQAKRPFVGNRLWVTSLTEPDGYRIDFESPTDVPEATEYLDEPGEIGPLC